MASPNLTSLLVSWVAGTMRRGLAGRAALRSWAQALRDRIRSGSVVLGRLWGCGEVQAGGIALTARSKPWRSALRPPCPPWRIQWRPERLKAVVASSARTCSRESDITEPGFYLCALFYLGINWHFTVADKAERYPPVDWIQVLFFFMALSTVPYVRFAFTRYRLFSLAIRQRSAGDESRVTAS